MPSPPHSSVPWPHAGMYKRVETQPGLDKFIGDASGLQRQALGPLFSWARAVVPAAARRSTPMFIMGTAGMRRLPDAQRADLLADIQVAAGGRGTPLARLHPCVNVDMLTAGQLLCWGCHAHLMPPCSEVLSYSSLLRMPRWASCSRLRSCASCHPSTSCLSDQACLHVAAAKSGFRFQPQWARTITGAEEGMYGWVALNYLQVGGVCLGGEGEGLCTPCTPCCTLLHPVAVSASTWGSPEASLLAQWPSPHTRCMPINTASHAPAAHPG